MKIISFFLLKTLQKKKNVLTNHVKMCYHIYVASRSTHYGEVVELVYGTSLENWRRFVAYRGFESHPLRQYDGSYKASIYFFI